MNANPLGQIGPILARDGKNYAPSEPILKLRDGSPKQGNELQEAVRELYLDRLKHQKTAWDELITAGQLVALMSRGEHMLERRRYGIGWYVRPINETEGYKRLAMNFMGFYRHSCCTKMLSVNPSVRIAAGDDNPRSIAAAQAARNPLDYWENKFYTEKFNWREALDATNNGTYIHMVKWNPFAEGPTEQKRQVDEVQKPIPGYGRCLDCPFESLDPSDFQQPENYSAQCPSCGSPAVEVTPSSMAILHRITMGQSVSCGAPEVVTTKLAAWRWDLAHDLEDSTWAILRQRLKLGDLKLLVGDAILPDTASSEDHSLDVLQRLAYGGQSSDGQGTSAFRHIDKTPTIGQFWAAPEDYAQIRVKQFKTVSGDTIEAGRLSDVFSGPVVFIGLNDMSTLVGIYGETHQTQVTTGSWFLDADSGAGRGIQDVAATQKRFNAADGHIYQGLAQHATPGVMVAKGLMKDDQAENAFRPGHTTLVNLTQLPAGWDDLRKAIFVSQPGQVNSQYIAYTQEFLKDAFQIQSLAIEFSSGFMNIDPKTATGSSIIANLANSLFGPMAGVKAGTRVKMAEMIIGLLAKHDRIGRYYPSKDGGRGQTVSGVDLGGRLLFDLEAGSDQPSSPVIDQKNWSSFVQAAGGLPVLIDTKQKEPQMFRESARLFGVKFEAEDADTISTICLGRLDQIQMMFQGGVTDPEILVSNLNPPVSVIEPKHPEKRDWWAAYLDLDEGLEAPLPIRQAAERMYWLHSNLEQQKQMPQMANQALTAGVAAAVHQAPSALGAQMMNRMNPQPMDENSARGLLKQAGGDKNKARKMALKGR